MKKFIKNSAVVLGIATASFHLPTQSFASDIEEQNAAYAKSSYTDYVLKNEDFQNLFTTFTNLSFEDPEHPDLSTLIKGMRDYYTHYCNLDAFTQDSYLYPYVPTGPYAFLVEIPVQKAKFTTHDELDALFTGEKMQNIPLTNEGALLK